MRAEKDPLCGKTYRQDDSWDETKPIQTWFSNSSNGLMLFIIFYTKACRWNKCTGCSLPSLSATRKIDFSSLMAQTDFVYNKPDIIAKLDQIKQIVVSNNGSVLDQETFSSAALVYFVAKTNILVPNLSVLTLESRPEYVDIEALEFLARALREGKTPTDLEVAVGMEAFDGHIRNKVFKKGLSLTTLEQLAEKLARYNFRLKCYLMQKPVSGITNEDAVQDVKNAIDYLNSLAERFGVRLNIHLNPTYVAVGTALEPAFREGRYEPPYLRDVVRAVWHAREKKISIHVGLNDEGLAVSGGSFLRKKDDKVVECLDAFNATQDYSLLGPLIG